MLRHQHIIFPLHSLKNLTVAANRFVKSTSLVILNCLSFVHLHIQRGRITDKGKRKHMWQRSSSSKILDFIYQRKDGVICIQDKTIAAPGTGWQ